MSEGYEYYRDFHMDILWRWDGSRIELYSLTAGTPGGEWWDDSENWVDLEDLNYGYAGTVSEAVPVDQEGNRI